MRCVGILICCVWLFAGVPAHAASLFTGTGAGSDGAAVPLVPVALRADPEAGGMPGGSLFAGRQGGSLFAPVAPRARIPRGVPDGGAPRGYMMPLAFPQVVSLRRLIASVEAGPAEYDAVVFSARIKPPKRPTEMSLQEIFDWIDATPGQHHAIGRYQFIPKTLRAVMREVGAPPEARFTPALQDRLADVLLVEAGLAAYMRGDMPQTMFMNNLARIWAGLPNSTGKSHYAGIAGNKAGMSWARFQREMDEIFPGTT